MDQVFPGQLALVVKSLGLQLDEAGEFRYSRMA